MKNKNNILMVIIGIILILALSAFVINFNKEVMVVKASEGSQSTGEEGSTTEEAKYNPQICIEDVDKYLTDNGEKFFKEITDHFSQTDQDPETLIEEQYEMLEDLEAEMKFLFTRLYKDILEGGVLEKVQREKFIKIYTECEQYVNDEIELIKQQLKSFVPNKLMEGQRNMVIEEYQDFNSDMNNWFSETARLEGNMQKFRDLLPCFTEKCI